MSTPTPIVDAVLSDALGVPRNVDVWLRTIERSARALRARTEDLCASDGALPLVVDVNAALVAFLDTPGASALHRIIRRPLPQLAAGTPAHHSFSNLSGFLFRQAEEALQLQEAAEGLRRKVAEVRERFGIRAPYFTEVHLRAARVEGADLVRARRVADIRAMEFRLTRAEQALERMAARFPRERDRTEGDWEMIEGSEASADELRAALAFRLQEKNAARTGAATTRALRETAVRHLSELGSTAGWQRPASRSVHLVAERLAGDAVRPDESLAHDGEDVILWGGLLQTAQAVLHDGDPESWQPRLKPLAAEEEPGTGTTLWAIPVDDTYVLLTPEIRSPVRVASRGVRLGKTVECKLFGTPGMPEDTAVGKVEVAPFFDGMDVAEPRWFKNHRNARFEVVGRRGPNWFARLRQRGEVKRLRTPAWEEDSRTVGAVRLLPAASALPPRSEVEVGPAGTTSVQFTGFQTDVVRTPLLDYGTAWLRTAAQPSSGAQEALERERELFRLLNRNGAGGALRFLGSARITGTRTSGVLYARPYALRLEECPPVEQWLQRESRTALIRAVARLLTTIHETGYALGVCHMGAFAFGMEWRSLSAPPHPTATLIHAPAATRLGHYHAPPQQTSPTDTVRYSHLCFKGFPPAVEKGETALPETDAAAFAVFALDVLAEKPLPMKWASLKWDDIPFVIADCAEQCFPRPQLAIDVARTLADRSRWKALLQWQVDLAQRSEPLD